jgi:hypothetical protein
LTNYHQQRRQQQQQQPAPDSQKQIWTSPTPKLAVSSKMNGGQKTAIEMSTTPTAANLIGRWSEANNECDINRMQTDRERLTTTISGSSKFDLGYSAASAATAAVDIPTSISGPPSCSCSSCAAAAAEAIDENTINDDDDSNMPFSKQLAEDIREIRRLLRSYSHRLEDRDSRDRVLAEWRLVARVLDRTFFAIYCAAVIISMVTVFPRGADSSS